MSEPIVSKWRERQAGSKPMRVAVVTVATGKYTEYIPPLFESFLKFFQPTADSQLLVFTDGPVPKHDRLVKVPWRKLGWPDDTMKRYHAFLKNWNVFEGFDHVVHIDADMRFAAHVGPEILGDLVATQHPGFVGQRGTYETDSRSAAYVAPEEGDQYFCGGFNGASNGEFLKLAYAVVGMVDKDRDGGRTPLWHDESCVNRYYVDNPPTKILSPSYCYPESWQLPYRKIVLALDKAHDEMRDWPDDWWNRQAEDRIEDFRKWVGTWDTPSRNAVRDYVSGKGYTSITDVGCGIGVDYDGYQAVGSSIQYTGVDTCTFFVEELKKRGIHAVEGTATSLPLLDADTDVVYMRHVLEHLSGYEEALKEAIRVASKEVLVIFFLPPGSADRIELTTLEGVLLYHNEYAKDRMERFLLDQPGVRHLAWEEVGERETLLHVYLEEKS